MQLLTSSWIELTLSSPSTGFTSYLIICQSLPTQDFLLILCISWRISSSSEVVKNEAIQIGHFSQRKTCHVVSVEVWVSWTRLRGKGRGDIIHWGGHYSLVNTVRGDTIHGGTVFTPTTSLLWGCHPISE